MKNPFESIRNAITKEKPAEKRLIRHPQESEIIEIALANLSQSEAGQELVDFADENEIKITILRGRNTRDYTSNAKNAYVVVADHTDIEDPDITIHLTGALREAIQEYEPSLRRLGIDKGEQMYTHREMEKFDDKLFWQTIIVYEVGILANRTEFIDSFATMGYYNLIGGYEKDLTSN